MRSTRNACSFPGRRSQIRKFFGGRRRCDSVDESARSINTQSSDGSLKNPYRVGLVSHQLLTAAHPFAGFASLEGARCAAWEGYATKESHRASSGLCVRRNSLRSGAPASCRLAVRARFSRAFCLRERTDNDIGGHKFHGAIGRRSAATHNHRSPADVSAGRHLV